MNKHFPSLSEDVIVPQHALEQKKSGKSLDWKCRADYSSSL